MSYDCLASNGGRVDANPIISMELERIDGYDDRIGSLDVVDSSLKGYTLNCAVGLLLLSHISNKRTRKRSGAVA